MRTLMGLALLAVSTPAFAQQADPHAGHAAAAQPPADPHAGHAMGGAAPPPVARDNAADAVYGPAAMEAARAGLRAEHGDVRYAKWMLETAEFRPSSDEDGYGFEGQVSFGGDINRFAFKTELEGEGGALEEAEVQAIYSRAISPYFNLQAGVRHDFEPGPSTTYAVLGIEGLAPYWFEVGAAVFLSEHGDVTARLEASYDLRLTQRWVLEPGVELNLDKDGLSEGEYGLRLRYAIEPHFSPYVGVLHRRRYAGTKESDTRAVVGLRAFF